MVDVGPSALFVVGVATLDEVRSRVAEGYGRLGMPTWPNPHEGMAPARDEEYSRVTEPDRYDIVHARARAWADVLGEVPGVEIGTAPLDDFGRSDRFDRGVRLTSSRPDTLPLLLLERDAPVTGSAASLAVLHVSVVRPGIAVAVLPDCGCDACDFGSADLLAAIDQTIATVVGGPFVVLVGEGWTAQWHPDGGSSSGMGLDHASAMELCERLAGGQTTRAPDGIEAFVGRPWL
jgi:hypothetical protein